MHINNKGQAMVELAGSLFFLSVLVFGMISVGCYIYDKCVFNQAVNKALDRAIAISIDSKITKKDITKIQYMAMNYINGSVFTSDPTARLDTSTSGKITLTIESKYNCNIPWFNEIFGIDPKVSEKGTYEYKIK